MSTIQNEPTPLRPSVVAGAIDEICERLTATPDLDPDIACDFARTIFAKAPRRLLVERSKEELAGLTLGAFRFLTSGSGQPVKVEVVNPEEEGWSAPVTIVRAEVSDRPFIVDTIREYLNSEQLPIGHYVYPILGVERAEDGTITGITDPRRAEARSFVYCEIPRIEDVEERARLRGELRRRLNDVVLATDDFPAMLAALSDTIEQVRGYADILPARAAEIDEVVEFLEWLRDGNFVFLGYRAYEITEGAQPVLRVEKGSGLGILREEGRSAWAHGRRLDEVSEPLRRRVLEGPLLVTSKTNAESTVHRRARMDYIGVKKVSENATYIGEYRFLGLFTSKAYAESAEAIPILRRKLETVLRASGALPGSHDYKEIITIFNSMPKEDLFQASPGEITAEIQVVLGVLFSDDVHVTLRLDPLGRGVSVMVVLPRGKFSSEVRQRIQELLTEQFQGDILNYHLAMGAGDQARLHFHVATNPAASREVGAEEIEGRIRQIIRSWKDRLQDVLEERLGTADAHQLAPLYAEAYPEEYQAATLPEVAADDLLELERMRREGTSVAIRLRDPRGRGRAEEFRDVTILNLYLVGERLVLSDFMPILDNAGLRVIEVAPFALAAESLPPMMIYSFAVQDPATGRLPQECSGLLAEAMLAVREGLTQNDPFNALVIRAGLRWREVDIIRMYANYAFQAGMTPTRFGTARALAAHPELARLLVDYFVHRFDPDVERTSGPDERARELRAAITSGLDSVTTLSEDRAIRRIASLIDATTRTNYFRNGGADPSRQSGGAPYISVKIRSGDVEELRSSRLLYEIFVFSSRMEGVHLRGARVSRGGIRWSDRHDDFRTEVLGLVHTQIVKNAVIVPSGSKGGFITKRRFEERGAMMEEAAEQYRTLIRGMLDLTDNIVNGKVVPPPEVVRHDEDDPYLVVAADKGTAHLSDVANAVAAEYDFWLGDAFASGGSHGYDHKKEGITARGAWECVKRHFRELGKDIQREPFTMVGIGDMSGDVFGNGLLLSRQAQLIAAFDHRHIFIDPDPDPEESYRERERLFRMERSSWADYDTARLSKGGMVIPRSSKEVEVTPEAKEALGLPAEVTSLDGEGLVRAVLLAPVELLWNGGIGTYVKAAEESHAEVGDPGNDPVRVDAEQLRCKVIGEGGNLGLTQAARTAFALRGGRLNTDALDNSGGVDMSDREVNLKILMAPAVASGAMTLEERNELLRELTDEVSALVLQDNVGQSLAVSLDEIRSREALSDFTSFISMLERERVLNRREEGLPSVDELEDRAREELGLMRPTLCVLLAHAKLRIQADLLASDLPDESEAEEYLVSYFPRHAVRAVGLDGVRAHRLRREIIATQAANDLVNLMGATFVERVARDTGRERSTVAAAWYVASRISGAAEIRQDLAELERVHPSATVYRWHLGLARVLERTTRWVLWNVDAEAPLNEVVERLLAGLSTLRREFGRLVAGEDRLLFEERMAELLELGIEPDLASRLITLRFLPELLDILRIARESETPPLETAEAYYLVGERFGLLWLQHLLRQVSPEDPWEKRFANTLISDLQRGHRGIGRGVLECRQRDESMTECVSRFEAARRRQHEAYQQVLAELRSVENPPLAAIGVAVRSLNALAAT